MGCDVKDALESLNQALLIYPSFSGDSRTSRLKNVYLHRTQQLQTKLDHGRRPDHTQFDERRPDQHVPRWPNLTSAGMACSLRQLWRHLGGMVQFEWPGGLLCSYHAVLLKPSVINFGEPLTLQNDSHPSSVAARKDNTSILIVITGVCILINLKLYRKWLRDVHVCSLVIQYRSFIPCAHSSFLGTYQQFGIQQTKRTFEEKKWSGNKPDLETNEWQCLILTLSAVAPSNFNQPLIGTFLFSQYELPPAHLLSNWSYRF